MTTAHMGEYRVTERDNESDGIVRVVAHHYGAFPVTLEQESVAASGSYIRVEQWIENDDQDGGCWEYM